MRKLLYSLIILIGVSLAGCGGGDDPAPDPCATLPAISVLSSTPTSTCNSEDATFTVSANGGTSPYEFSIDGGATFQSSGEFMNLAPGNYTVTVKDANGCTNTAQVVTEIGGSDLTATVNTTADTQCLDNNGVIAVNASGGSSPYMYSIGGDFLATATFESLAPGDYDVIVQDDAGCSITVAANVPRGDTGTSYMDQIEPIIMANCVIPGCHNGDNGESRNWSVFANVQANAEEIKARTQSGDMPRTGSLTEDEIALIACWVDDGAKDN